MRSGKFGVQAVVRRQKGGGHGSSSAAAVGGSFHATAAGGLQLGDLHAFLHSNHPIPTCTSLSSPKENSLSLLGAAPPLPAAAAAATVMACRCCLGCSL